MRITTRETVAAAQAEQLREQITTLAEQLAAVETELADLATTRATLRRLTGAEPGLFTLCPARHQQS